jgi:hypothetical protein
MPMSKGFGTSDPGESSRTQKQSFAMEGKDSSTSLRNKSFEFIPGSSPMQKKPFKSPGGIGGGLGSSSPLGNGSGSSIKGAPSLSTPMNKGFGFGGMKSKTDSSSSPMQKQPFQPPGGVGGGIGDNGFGKSSSPLGAGSSMKGSVPSSPLGSSMPGSASFGSGSMPGMKGKDSSSTPMNKGFGFGGMKSKTDSSSSPMEEQSFGSGPLPGMKGKDSSSTPMNKRFGSQKQNESTSPGASAGNMVSNFFSGFGGKGSDPAATVKKGYGFGGMKAKGGEMTSSFAQSPISTPATAQPKSVPLPKGPTSTPKFGSATAQTRSVPLPKGPTSTPKFGSAAAQPKIPSFAQGGMSSSPKFGSGVPTTPPGGFGNGPSFVPPAQSRDQSPSRAAEVSTILSSLENDRVMPDQFNQFSSRGAGNTYYDPNERRSIRSMPSSIGQSTSGVSVRDSGNKSNSETLLGSLASQSPGRSGQGTAFRQSRLDNLTSDFNANRNTRTTATSMSNEAAAYGRNLGGASESPESVRSGGDTIGGFKPLSVTVTNPRTGKKRTISVSSASESEEQLEQ